MKLVTAAAALIVLLQVQSPPKAGIVSGRILAPNGDPLVSMQVFLFSRSYDQKGRPFGRGAATDTNDRGEYRFFNVAPGRYYVYVKWSEHSVAQQQSTEPIRQVDARDSNGRRFSPTYYPSAASVDNASFIDVGSGVERTGVDVVMLPPSPASQQTWAVRGRLLDSTGAGLSREVLRDSRLVLVPRVSDTGWWSFPSAAPRFPDATFEFLEVADGKYWLSANLKTPAGDSSAVVPVDVSGGDTDDLILRLIPAANIVGKVTLDGASMPATDAAALKITLRITASPVFSGRPPQAVSVKPDGTFSIPDVQSGEYDAVLTGVPADAFVVQMKYGDAIVERQTLFVAGDRPATLEISMSAKTGQLSGVVAVPNAEVVLIPEGSPKLPERYKAVTADANGRFLIRGIAPGAYTAYSFDRLTKPFAYFDPAFIRDFGTQGKDIQIQEAKRAEVDLQVVATSR
jgi:hypothetical protein